MDEITSFLRCWGTQKSTTAIRRHAFWAQRSCQTDHNIYVARTWLRGKIEIQFYWLETDTLNSVQFYEHYEQIFSSFMPGNDGTEEDLGRWSCDNAFVAARADTTKAVLCARGYDNMPGLYDVLFLQGNVSREREAHMIHFTLAGTTRKWHKNLPNGL
ncbi:MAG: hypothetical protein CM15mP120_04910 [Pseudomonadota bacterium]|nr:MAG: hypothetical protein CM15mP120_04910 [Pseudomonadota bacterium]